MPASNCWIMHCSACVALGRQCCRPKRARSLDIEVSCRSQLSASLLSCKKVLRQLLDCDVLSQPTYKPCGGVSDLTATASDLHHTGEHRPRLENKPSFVRQVGGEMN